MFEHLLGDDNVFKRADTTLPVPVAGVWLCACWLSPALLYCLADYWSRWRRVTVHSGRLLEDVTEGPVAEAWPQQDLGGITVMLGSLEHSLPHLPRAKAVAGGLGKVMDLIARHHPTDIIMVHPMLAQDDRLDYGTATSEDAPLRILVNGEHQEVRVLRHTTWPVGQAGPRVEFLLLSHSWFEERHRQAIYPNPMSRVAVLSFFSLWNQAVGALICRHRPDVFHCPDFHTAIAPWYALPAWPRLRVLLVLHNAEYQGSISTDMIRGERLNTIANIFNLPTELAAKHLIQDGRFNMLKAALDFVVERQHGQGVCAVSGHYASECRSTYSMLWRLPSVESLDNPMLEEERVVLTCSLQEAKSLAKKRVQAAFGLEENPDARLFVSLGRLVRQKGVDVLADVAPWLLSSFANAQLIVVGPIADGFGHYAAHKLRALAEDERFQARLFVRCEFAHQTEELRLAADFCLMPSRDEPFGYVDIEFAWRGAVLVGAQAGGLGKVPGFYYVAQNRQNLGRLRRELRTAVTTAMRAPAEQLRQMSAEAMRCSFPLGRWQRRLQLLYRQLLSLPGQPVSNPPSGEGGFELMQARLLPERIPTFGPFATAASQPRELNPATAQPVSVVDSAIEEQPHILWGPAVPRGPELSEFLTQELDEEQLAERIRSKVRGNSFLSIDQILESVGSDMDMEKERGAVARWLLRPTFGEVRIHWVVSCGYVASPIAAFLAYVVACEWGLRGATRLPLWFKRFAWFKRVFGNGGLEPPLLNMLLFSTNALASAIGTPIWAALSRRVEPRVLLAACLLLQVPLLAAVLPIQPTVSVAVCLVFLQGLASSGSLLFISFNFMMTIKADMSHAALRMGILEMLRCCVNWLLTGCIFFASPSMVVGTASRPLPSEVGWLLAPIAALAFLTTFVPGLLCLFAPGPYRDDRLPGWDLGLLWRRKSFLLLGLSDCIGSLALFPSTCYVSWWLANGWSIQRLGWLSGLFAAFLAVGTGLWGVALSRALVHGLSFLIGVALLLAPAALLRAVVQEEVSTFTYLGSSEVAVVICLISLFFESMRCSASWAVKIRVLGSRWRLLSYGTVLLSFSNVAAVVSPFLCEWLARRYSSTFISGNQKELADAVLVSVVPLCSAQFVAQMLAAPFIRPDMGIVPSTEHGRRAPRGWRILRRAPVTLTMMTGLALGIAVFWLERFLVGRPLPYEPVHRCPAQGPPACSVVVDEVDTREAAFPQGSSYQAAYGLNRYGQKTTGRYNCLRRMRTVGGNTFVFWPYGRCQVQRCPGASSVQAAAEMKQAAEVWSRYCGMSGQNLVAVHAFEWRWEDVGHECEEYLGPAGFDMVQVSPPMEHALGSSWAVRYQPVSYQLESRAGTRQDFIDMVARCRRAGVAIMVDTILNHMAGPYVQITEHQGKECGEGNDTLPCEGWLGTGYGNREFLHGTPGLDRYERGDFHHYLGNERANCGLPPWTNNRHLCDLVGLPDLDTESKRTQDHLQAFLRDIFELGVTMLRVDAAMHIYPESIAKILEPFPWDYVVQEFYPAVLKYEKETLSKATVIGSLTDFDFGQRVAQVMFDSWDGTRWTNRSVAFGELLRLSQRSSSKCDYSICDTPYPSDNALLFMDNHDQQRARWKPQEGGPPESPVCKWDGRSIGACRPIYKHGLEYHLGQRFMLAWPYGDAVRLMSSFAWTSFEQGPPGVQEGSVRNKTSPLKCRSTPTTAPVTVEYDMDQQRPWVCEHRWEGVAGLVRFRKLIGSRAHIHTKWSDGEGHIAFNLGGAGFVALSRGYNWFTQQGSNATWDLAGHAAGMPAGKYCNLAVGSSPVPPPSHWTPACAGDVVLVNGTGFITQGLVPAAGVLAIHTSYRMRQGAASAMLSS